MHIDPGTLAVPVMGREEIGKDPRWRIELVSRARDLMILGIAVYSDKLKAYGRLQSVTSDTNTGSMTIHVSFLGGISVQCDDFAQCRIVGATLPKGDLPQWISASVAASVIAEARQRRVAELQHLLKDV